MDKRTYLSPGTLALAALMAALTAIGSWFFLRFPFSPVPVTAQTVFVLLSGFLLGPRLGLISQGVYLLLGAVGLPVFSEFGAGIGVLLGPSGGFLLGFLPASCICGYLSKLRPAASFFEVLAYSILATSVVYAPGVFWLAFVCSLDARCAIAIGVLPFIPGDLAKALLVSFLVVRIRKVIRT